MTTPAPSIEIIALPNGLAAFQVAKGLIFAKLAAAERFAAALAAKVARVARKAAAARKGTLAKRVARLIAKANRLIEGIEARGRARVERIAAVEGDYSNRYIAAQGERYGRVGRVNFRIYRLKKLLAG